jgi:hypothetical protein
MQKLSVHSRFSEEYYLLVYSTVLKVNISEEHHLLLQGWIICHIRNQCEAGSKHFEVSNLEGGGGLNNEHQDC